MSKRVAGVAYLKVDGNQFSIKGSWEIPLNSTVKEPVMGVAGHVGHKETAMIPYMKGDVVFEPDFPIQTLNNLTNATITVECANGQTATLTNAYVRGEIPVDIIEGAVPLEFAGDFLSWDPS